MHHVRLLLPLFAGLAACLFLPAQVQAQAKKEYQVIIVSDDDKKEKFVDVRKGFTETLDKALAAQGSTARYTVLDTRGDKARVADIIAAIDTAKPDLIGVINNSGVFADTHITSALKDPRYRFVSENCIPVQSGMAQTWDLPGGNVTGVGVFTQFTSIIKLAQAIDPRAKELYFWTWESPATKLLNEFFEAEITAAAKATGVRLVEFKRLASAEDQFAYMKELDGKGPETFAMSGLSVWVHKDGSPANMAVEETAFWRTSIRRLRFYGYDEAAVRNASPAGACIVWYDIGAQMADKAMLILGGRNPGSIPWSYPRKYNIMLNLEGARQIGLDIPQKIISAAYRVYTDYNGTFKGQKN